MNSASMKGAYAKFPCIAIGCMQVESIRLVKALQAAQCNVIQFSGLMNI